MTEKARVVTFDHFHDFSGPLGNWVTYEATCVTCGLCPTEVEYIQERYLPCSVGFLRYNYPDWTGEGIVTSGEVLV